MKKSGKPALEFVQHPDASLHLGCGHVQPVDLPLDTAVDSFKCLTVVAALHHHVLAAVCQHLPFAVFISDTGHEPLSQPLAVAVLERGNVAAHIVLGQNGGDLPGADTHIREQRIHDLRFRLGGQDRPAGRARSAC